jgi:hypothetical protein
MVLCVTSQQQRKEGVNLVLRGCNMGVSDAPSDCILLNPGIPPIESAESRRIDEAGGEGRWCPCQRSLCGKIGSGNISGPLPPEESH